MSKDLIIELRTHQVVPGTESGIFLTEGIVLLYLIEAINNAVGNEIEVHHIASHVEHDSLTLEA